MVTTAAVLVYTTGTHAAALPAGSDNRPPCYSSYSHGHHGHSYDLVTVPPRGQGDFRSVHRQIIQLSHAVKFSIVKPSRALFAVRSSSRSKNDVKISDLTLSSHCSISEPLVLFNEDPQATDQPPASHPSHTHTHTINTNFSTLLHKVCEEPTM